MSLSLDESLVPTDIIYQTQQESLNLVYDNHQTDYSGLWMLLGVHSLVLSRES